MNQDLLDYISGIEGLDKNEARAIAENIHVETFPKGTVLLREGEVSSNCYSILKGCIRQYHLADGEEKTTAFFTEGQAVASFTSLSQQIPSSHYLICSETTTAMVGNPEKDEAMYKQFPKLVEITRGMMEQSLGENQEAFARFIASSPEERYTNLLKTRPDLFNRVPQHQIASYLGMKPESLSRIRKRVASKVKS